MQIKASQWDKGLAHTPGVSIPTKRQERTQRPPPHQADVWVLCDGVSQVHRGKELKGSPMSVTRARSMVLAQGRLADLRAAFGNTLFILSTRQIPLWKKAGQGPP